MTAPPMFGTRHVRKNCERLEPEVESSTHFVALIVPTPDQQQQGFGLYWLHALV